MHLLSGCDNAPADWPRGSVYSQVLVQCDSLDRVSFRIDFRDQNPLSPSFHSNDRCNLASVKGYIIGC